MSYKMKGFSGFKSPLKQNGNPKKKQTEKEKWIEKENKRKPFKEEWHKDYFYNKAKYEKPDTKVKRENIA